MNRKNMETISPKKAIIFIGLQASGKSTFYHQRWEKDHVHINLDILHTRNKERLLLEDCLKKGRSFVVDNTNPAVADREKYILMAKEYGYETEGYFFRSVIVDCVERNRKRTGKSCVPEKAIVYTSNRLELPSYREGFDRLYFVRIEQNEFIVEEWRETE